MSRVFDLALDTPWAITEESLCLLLEIAGRKLDADLELPGSFEPDSVAVQTGSELEGARRATVRDNVAIVPVLGPIFRYANIFTEVSGATSVELLARDFNAALKNPDVEAILLDVDSPGGQVNGISEMSDLIVGARGQLPIHAFVSGSGASAAYWLASSADEVVVADTALVGSIGVRAAFVDRSEQDRQRGIKRIEFVSSQSPQKVPDPTEEDGRDQIQARVDELADVFINAVARNRGVTRGRVLEDFGQGRVFVGEDAVRAGLVDGVGTFERTLARLREETMTDRGRSGLAAGIDTEEPMADADKEQKPIEDRELSAEQLREAFPDAVSEIELAAGEESALAERERILAIRDLDAPGHEELKADAMADPEATPESVSRAIVEAEAERRRAQLAAQKKDEEELDAPDNRAGAEELDGPAAEAQAIIAAGQKAGVIRTG